MTPKIDFCRVGAVPKPYRCRAGGLVVAVSGARLCLPFPAGPSPVIRYLGLE